MTVPAPTSASPGCARAPTRPPPRRRFQEALQRADPAAPPRVPAARPLARSSAHGLSERAAEAASPAAAPAVPPSSLTPPPGISELQAAVRAAPPAIASAVAGAAGNGPAQLSLGFGAALSVDLRTGAQGLELSLRPAPSLDRAARAELPRLVEALRSRGLRVARAEVRSTPAAEVPARAR